jgi:[ribosomal protein S5]-alanine N-acetyltransferase
MISGSRVSLRLVDQGDLEVLHRFLCDVESVGPYFPCSLEPRCRLQARIAADGYWSAHEGRMVIVDAAANVVGWIMFFKPHSQLDAVEIGYVIFDRSSRNKGYATEALALFVQLLFRTTPVHRIELNIAIDNAASRRVAEKCGFVFEGVAREVWYAPALGRRLDGARYAILRPPIP